MPRRLLLLASLFLLAAPAAAHAYTFAEWDATGGPAGIARSGDFTYFTLGGLHSVGRATLGGVQISPFAALNGTEPTTLIAGPAGTLLFTDAVTNKVGRVTPAAAGDTATEFSEPTADHPVDLALDTHGDIWVAVSNGDLDCVNPAGGAVEVYSSQLAHPVAIAAGGDGALWLADSNAGAIARVVPAADCLTAPAGVSFPVRPGEAHPVDIAAAQAGTHLFLAVDGALDEVTPHGAQPPDFAPVPLSPDSRPSTVHSDATGVWWVDQANRRVGKYAAGTATEWALPRGSGAPADFAIASDKSLWYVAPADDVIGRFSEETGVPGQDGADGADGQNGAPGAPGPQGPAGANGANGANGAPGPRGATGPTGAKGATGRRGKPGAAAKLPKISCRLSGSSVKCRFVKRRGADGTVGGGESRVRLSLQRAGHVYARASGALKSSTVRLRPVRPVKPGRYTLVVTVGRTVSVRLPLRIG